MRIFDIRPFVLAAPSDIVRYLAKFPDDYFRAALITCSTPRSASRIAVVVALVVGAAMAASTVRRARDPTGADADRRHAVRRLHRVGHVGLGCSPTSRVVFIVALVSLPAFAFAAADGMRSADPASRELLASVDASRWEVLWRLRLPSALPSLFTAARYNLGLALIVAYLVEGGNSSGPRRDRQRASRRQPGRPAVGGDLLDGACSAPSAWCCSTCCSGPSMGWHVSQRSQRQLTGYGAWRWPTSTSSDPASITSTAP